jgi:hypothetical protein
MSSECRSKSGHKSRKQIIWKCITVQIFGNDNNKSTFYSGDWILEMLAIIQYRAFCILVCRLKRNYQNQQTYKFACGSVWLWNLVSDIKREHRLRVFENRVLRIVGPKRDEVTGGWRKLHKEEFRDLYSSPSIIRMIKSRKIRWYGEGGTCGRSVDKYILESGTHLGPATNFSHSFFNYS